MKNDGGYAVLTAAVGVDDSTDKTRQPVRFYVYGDGTLVAESPPLVFGAKAHRLKADIRGRKIIELVVRVRNEPTQRWWWQAGAMCK